MARYLGPKLKLSRREGSDLNLKSARRSFDSKVKSAEVKPGQHGKTSGQRLSDYGTQLREKQKVRRVYGVLEKQFHGYFVHADMAKGVTGANLLAFLERRLDNVVYRLGFANSRTQARQLVRHGVFTLNGHKVTIPSLQVKVGDSVEVPEKSRTIPVLAEAQEAVARRGCPSWLEVDALNFKGIVKALPQRDDIQFPINEHLIVELYSK